MLEEARGTEMSMLYGVTALGEAFQQRVVYTRLLPKPRHDLLYASAS